MEHLELFEDFEDFETKKTNVTTDDLRNNTYGTPCGSVPGNDKSWFAKQNTLIDFETAKIAKIKGFPVKDGDLGYYFVPADDEEEEDEYSYDAEIIFVTVESYLPAPTQSFLQKWLRDNHKLHIQVFNVNKPVDGKWSYEINRLPVGVIVLWTIDSPYFDSYEDALEAALNEALRLIEE